VAIRLDQLEEELKVIVPHVGVDELSSLAIHHADVHLPGMEIDSAVELRRSAIILHLIIELIGVREDTGCSVVTAGSACDTPRPSHPMLANTNKGFPGSINALHRIAAQRRQLRIQTLPVGPHRGAESLGQFAIYD
jgi:hypothetical protein